MEHQINRSIRTPEDLGVACIGSPYNAIVPAKRLIDRAEAHKFYESAGFDGDSKRAFEIRF